MAARTDACDYLRMPEYIVVDGHRYKQKGKDKMVRSRMLFCRAGFKQNIGFCGKEIVVCAVRRPWPLPHDGERVRCRTRQFVGHIVCKPTSSSGDLNMSLTHVGPHLRSRGLQVDCAAWYPWLHTTTGTNGQRLVFNAMGIFVIGGSVEVTPTLGWRSINALTPVAGDGTERLLIG